MATKNAGKGGTVAARGVVNLSDGRKFRTLGVVAKMRRRVGINLGGVGIQDADWAAFVETPGDEGAKARLTQLMAQVVPAALHCFREVLDNAIDEHLKGGQCKRIEVWRTGPYGFSIFDDGRGLPPTLFHVFHRADTGSNFEDAFDGAEVSRGQNGIGTKAVRAVSAYFRVTSRYQGKTYAQVMTPGPAIRKLASKLSTEAQHLLEEKFFPETAPEIGLREADLRRAMEEDGCLPQPVPRKDDPITGNSGTLVEVVLNPLVFSDSERVKATGGGFLPIRAAADEIVPDVPQLPANVIDAICRETALIFPKMKVIFHREGSPRDSSSASDSARAYSYPLGPVGLARALGVPYFRMTHKAEVSGRSFECEALVMAGDAGINLSFVNGSSTRGGTHVDDLQTMLADALRDTARDLKRLAKEIEVTRDDVRRATHMVVDVRMTAPSFSSQTKERLTDTWIKPHLKEMVSRAAKRINREAPAIIEAVAAAAKARHEMRENREAEKQLKKGKGARPIKLVDANTSDRSKTILFLAEGDSAAAGFRAVRDEATQGILPLKGVVMNCAGIPFHRAIKNDEIAAIVSAIGLPSPSSERPPGHKLHFERVAMITDADVDGAHIRSLLITMFVTYWPWFARDNLYYGIPPLFEILPRKLADMDESDRPAGSPWPIFAVSEGERDAVLTRHPRENLAVQRNKGLGEQSEAAWRHLVTDPKLLVKLVLDARALQVIEKWSDKSAAAAKSRRDELAQNVGSKSGVSAKAPQTAPPAERGIKPGKAKSARSRKV